MAATGASTGVGATIEAPGAPALAAQLQRWGSRLEDARPEFEEMIRVLRPQSAAVFDSSGRALGTSWAAHADGSTDRILVATGELRRSLASKDGMSIEQVSPTELRFGTAVPYGRFNQYGTSNMPARPFLGITPATRKRLAELMRSAEIAGGMP